MHTEIRICIPEGRREGECNHYCPFLDWEFGRCVFGWSRPGSIERGTGCPGPGRYELIRVREDAPAKRR